VRNDQHRKALVAFDVANAICVRTFRRDDRQLGVVRSSNAHVAIVAAERLERPLSGDGFGAKLVADLRAVPDSALVPTVQCFAVVIRCLGGGTTSNRSCLFTAEAGPRSARRISGVRARPRWSMAIVAAGDAKVHCPCAVGVG